MESNTTSFKFTHFKRKSLALFILFLRGNNFLKKIKYRKLHSTIFRVLHSPLYNSYLSFFRVFLNIKDQFYVNSYFDKTIKVINLFLKCF